ncbi:uncharacterized protein LOC124818538 isoform X2 [Hydra vulgaris]|uniref:Uncharacterized protein LOC124818538 isoform X2 n=2 Tax=Hydra vulgaris TaxID=6087 RepID=A0ABM4BSJ4_HYDVU
MTCNLNSHIHQNDSHFNRCSDPLCKVAIDRIRKISILRTKEHEVLEKYDKMLKVQDSINKRRQSVSPHFGFSRPKSVGALLECDNKSEIGIKKQRRWTILQSSTVPSHVQMRDADARNNVFVSSILRTNEVREIDENNFFLQHSSDSLIKNFSKFKYSKSMVFEDFIQENYLPSKSLQKSFEEVSKVTNKATVTDASNCLVVSTLLPMLPTPKVCEFEIRKLETKKKLEVRRRLLQEFDEEIQKVNKILKHM